MKRGILLLAALLASGCASSDWVKTESVPGGRLYIPKLYAPLLPGSIYPDKKVPIPAKARPAVVLVCPAAGDCRKDAILDQAAQRGLVVFVGRDPNADLLRTRAEADPERIGWLLVQPAGDFLRRWTALGAVGRAVAIMRPPHHPGVPGPLPFSPSKKIFLAALLEGAPLEANDEIVLKLYSPNNKGLLPNEAFRDAVEWLAAELASR